MKDWNILFPKEKQPAMQEIEAYIGDKAYILKNLIFYMETAYQAKPKLSYSGCSMKPGWNLKYSKSGQALGTIYPESGLFSIFLVLSYKYEASMELLLPLLSDETRVQYQKANDYMKIGKYLLLTIDNLQKLEDYKKIIAVKLPLKIK